MLTFQFALDEKDSAHYYEARVVENLKLGWRPLQKYVLVWSFCILSVGYLDFTEGRFPSYSFVALATVIIAGIQYKLPQRKSLSFAFRQALTDQYHSFLHNAENTHFFEAKTYLITDKGVEVLSNKSQCKYFLPAFVKRKDTTTHIFLFTDQVSILVFPKNKIAALAEFEAMLSRHISFHAEIGRKIK